MTPELIKAAAIAALAALIFAAGWMTEGWRKDGQIARLESAQANERARDAAESAAELQAAVSRGNELAARVAAAEATRDTALQETQHALRKTTTGRPCLNAGAVRLLNGPGLAAPMPAAAGQPAGADAPAASDTDVAFWAAHARRAYDTCRGRIDALNEFFEEAK
jgi:prophage endopeptidase